MRGMIPGSKVRITESGPLVAGPGNRLAGAGLQPAGPPGAPHRRPGSGGTRQHGRQEGDRAKEGVHFGFGFRVPDGVVRMDIPWAVVRPEADQLPGACKNWFTVQRFVDISNDNSGVTWATIDAPLVEMGGLTANLPGTQGTPECFLAHIKPSQTLYSWVMNNHWYTNYKADQEGPTTFRYAIRPHAGYDAVAAQRFGIECSQPLVVLPARGAAPRGGPSWNWTQRT